MCALRLLSSAHGSAQLQPPPSGCGTPRATFTRASAREQSHACGLPLPLAQQLPNSVGHTSITHNQNWGTQSWARASSMGAYSCCSAVQLLTPRSDGGAAPVRAARAVLRRSWCCCIAHTYIHGAHTHAIEAHISHHPCPPPKVDRHMSRRPAACTSATRARLTSQGTLSCAILRVPYIRHACTHTRCLCGGTQNVPPPDPQ